MNTVLSQANKTAQSLLLIGATRDDALALAKRILGEQHHLKIDSGNHPDLHLYEPDEKSGLHSMASMQKLIREMALPPFEAKSKVFILPQAEKMLPSSSNALLKTLEEPNSDSYFLLLTEHAEALLPTILSRLYPIVYAKNEIEQIDVLPLIQLAQKGLWDELLDQISTLDELNPQAVLHGFLCSENDPVRFQKLSQKVLEAQKAIDHNVKPRTVYFQIISHLCTSK